MIIQELKGLPKGPQSLGTLTLLARSSVLYLCEGDGVDRSTRALIQLEDVQLSIPVAKGYPLFARSFSLFLSVIKCLSTHIVRVLKARGFFKKTDEKVGIFICNFIPWNTCSV